MTQLPSPARPGPGELEQLRHLRDAEPVRHDPESGAWSVYRFDDVAAILSDAHTFSSNFGEVFPQARDVLLEGNIVAMDPPRHDQLRSLVSQAFTPRAIAQLEGRIGEIATELLDRIEGASQFELVSDFAYPLPVIVIAELLGVP